MKVHNKIALRYIFSKRSFNFISIITFISILGITAGVAALICVLSIFNGFQKLTEQQIVGFDPHIRISPIKGKLIENPKPIIQKIKRINGTVSIEAVKSGRIAAVSQNSVQVFNLICVDKRSNYLKKINESIVLRSKNKKNTLQDILIGAALADRLNVFPGDTIRLITPEKAVSSFAQMNMNAGEQVVIKGLFQTNVKDYDLTIAFADFTTGENLFNLPGENCSFIDIRLNSLESAPKVLTDLAFIKNFQLKAETWQDLNKDLYRVMQFERMAAFAILSIIIIIAVFNILASLSMTVTEKQRDIALLKAIGGSDNLISKIFLSEGLIIGFIGTFAGAVIGVLLTLGQINFKWFKIDTTKFIVDSIPASLSWTDTVMICIVSLLLTFFATILPARKAAKTNISQALRSE